MEVQQHLLVIVTLALGGVLQGMMGFGFGLFTVPVLLYMGMKPHEAVMIMAIGSLSQSTFGVRHMRADVRWRKLVLPAAVLMVTVPVGVWLLGHVSAMDKTRYRQLFGCLLLCVLALMWLVRVKPRPHLHFSWAVLAATTSGIVGGLSGMGGPPMVLWVTAHTWTNRQIRSALLFQFVCFNPIQICALWLRFGSAVTNAMLLALVCVPVVLLGSAVGLRLGHRLPEYVLRRVMMGLLTVIAAIGLLGPLL